MRVLYAIDTLGSGGAQRQAVELAAHLVRAGRIEAHFLAYHQDDFFEPRLVESGIEVHRPRKLWKIDPLYPRRVRSLLQEHPVDVIHAFLHAPSLYALLAVRGLPAARRPAVVAAERNSQIATTFAEARLHAFIYRRADAVTVNASAVAADIESRCGVPSARIHYLPNGIDLDAWDAAARRPCPYELDESRQHIGLIGRISHQKNQDLLLDALAGLAPDERRRWCAWIVGAGATDSVAGRRLHVRARELGLSDCVQLRPPHRDVAALMARLSMVVLPSRFEGFPNVVLEAMASALPVVASRVGDVPNMIEHGRSGWIIPSDDADALTDALRSLERLGAEGRHAMGEAARSRVESHYGMDAIADRHVELYHSLSAT